MGLLGIDLGSRAIKLLQLRRHGSGYALVGAGRVDVRTVPTDVTQQERLADQLRAVLGAGGFTGRRCVVSLPRSEVRTQSVRLPIMSEAELRQAAVWEASQRFGVDRAQMEVDLIRTGAEIQGSENREEVLLIAVTHDVIRTWVEPMLAAGLRPVAMETHFAALTRTFGHAPRTIAGRPAAQAIVDVGFSGSTVIILRGDEIAFCKSIGIGGRHFDQSVAEHLQMDPEAARDLRASRIASWTSHHGEQSSDETGPATDSSVDRAVYDAVRPLFGSFAKEIGLCLSYYGVAFRGHPPQKMILTGGDGLEPRLADTLADQCKIPVELDENVSVVGPLMTRMAAVLGHDPGPSASWSVAAGSSLRDIAARRLGRARAIAQKGVA